MDRLSIDNILNITALISELELERATLMLGKLRWMKKDDPGLIPLSKHLVKLIQQYEEEHWVATSDISEAQLILSDEAVQISSSENSFILKRKELIKKKLKTQGLAQKDLAKILGHRPNYMSELINGVRPFSKDDLIIIHRLFKIDFKYLIPPFIRPETTNHINKTLQTLKNNTLSIS